MRKVVFFIFLFGTLSVQAQLVEKRNQNINSRKYPGFSVTLNGAIGKVSVFWDSYLENLAKRRKKRDFLEVSEFKIPDAYYPEAIYYSRLIEKESTTGVWVALDPESLLAGEEGESLVNIALESFMAGLPLSYERYAMELKIMETEQAIGFQARQKEGLESDIVSLGKKLENSKEERIRLQRNLDNLELSILATAQRIENNKSAVEQNEIGMQKMQDLLLLYKKMLDDLK